MNERSVVFILGGGSGTSALTRLLSLSGCALPASVLGADDFNPRGYWEPSEALRINDEFLLHHGSTFFDPTLRIQEELHPDAEAEARFRSDVEAFLRDCAKSSPVVIKDPRITPLFTWWKEAAQRCGLAVKVIHATRHPGEVAAALSSVLRTSLELSYAIWLKYNLLSERLSRDVPRVFVNYANMLDDWRREVGRISAALSLTLSADNPAVDGFITRDLYRRRHEGPPPDPFGLPWVSSVHALLSDAAMDAPVDTGRFDEIYDAFRSAERTFRKAFEDSRRKHRPDVIRAMTANAPKWAAGRDY